MIPENGVCDAMLLWIPLQLEFHGTLTFLNLPLVGKFLFNGWQRTRLIHPCSVWKRKITSDTPFFSEN